MIKIKLDYEYVKIIYIIILGASTIWSAYLLVFGFTPNILFWNTPLIALRAGLLIAGIIEGFYFVRILQNKYIIRNKFDIQGFILIIAIAYTIFLTDW